MVGRRRLFTGPGGSGRTHHLRAWADSIDRHITGRVLWIRGSVDHRELATPPRRLLETLGAATIDDAIVVDDAHWLPDDIVEAILHLIDERPIAVARANYPDSSLLRELDDALTVHEPRQELLPCSDDGIANWIERDGSQANTDAVARATVGWSGLVALLVDSHWTGATPTIPIPVVDAVARRARAAGAEVTRAGQLMVLGADVPSATAIAAESGEPERVSDVERRLRSSGLLDGDRLIPIVHAAIASDVTETERTRQIEQLVGNPDLLEPDVRAALILERDSQPNESDSQQLDRVAAAVRLGDASAAALVATLPDLADPPAADAVFVLDMRAMRWTRAAGRPIVGRTSSRRLAVAEALQGRLELRNLDRGPDTSDVRLLDDLLSVMRAYAAGEDREVLRSGAHLVDDAIASNVELGLGWSVAAIVAPLVAASGDPSAAGGLARAAAAAGLEGPGEQRAHVLLAAYFELVTDDYTAALELVRLGAGDGWPHRDLLLLAALDAAIARRSGDTTRLRDAWRRCDTLLTRQSVTWVLLDPLIEVMAAGRRVGDTERVSTIVDAVRHQMDGWDDAGRGPVDDGWMRLQIAVAAEDWASVMRSGTELSETQCSAARCSARRLAGAAWTATASQQLGNSRPLAIDRLVDEGVDALVSVGDGWEASRLLGQAALDHPDPSAVRTLLERARSLVAGPIDSADGLVGAGLSEREADVARLVAEGRTYKEIGAQLFISAKTVEHHVARIRQRLGAGSRAELLTLIRELSRPGSEHVRSP